MVNIDKSKFEQIIKEIIFLLSIILSNSQKQFLTDAEKEGLDLKNIKSKLKFLEKDFVNESLKTYYQLHSYTDATLLIGSDWKIRTKRRKYNPEEIAFYVGEIDFLTKDIYNLGTREEYTNLHHFSMELSLMEIDNMIKDLNELRDKLIKLIDKKGNTNNGIL